jgi:hypothetical protein
MMAEQVDKIVISWCAKGDFFKRCLIKLTKCNQLVPGGRILNPVRQSRQKRDQLVRQDNLNHSNKALRALVPDIYSHLGNVN